MLVHCRVSPVLSLPEYPFIHRVERDTVRVKYLAYPWPGFKPGLLDLEMSVLTTRPMHLSYVFKSHVNRKRF